ncbi:DDE-type integrase/transposase/recombinase [Corynebacterium belfantii]|nr:DDE-type integrase/transposase/recombinase [Corynebacterium belfantii]MBG9331181.1 DDE-type integrase/transposase/recombinase [Corynebacterium belfantii]
MFAPVKPLDSQRTSSIPNLVTRVFDAGELNRVWMSDITYLRTGEGWLYLCVVRDGHSRRVLGWAMDSVHNTDLVERALRMAYTLRGGGADGVVFHADRGAQFMSGLHRGVLRQCDGRVVLVDAENRVLQPSTLRHPR